MELKSTAAIHRTHPTLPAIPTQQQEKEPIPKSTTPSRQQSREDRIELSQQALEFLQGQQPPEETEESPGTLQQPMTAEERRQQAQQDKLKATQQMISVMRQQSIQLQEQNEKQLDSLKKSLDEMKKCSRIARNISKGHKVPPQDEKYLLEHDAKAYMMAMVLRMMEEEKKKVKSELDDEDADQEAQSVKSTGGAEPAGGAELSVEAADGGGEAVE